MDPRIDCGRAAPGALHALMGVEAYIGRSSLEPALLHLVRIRASQINGSACCLDLHTKKARAGGETEQRLNVLPGWREAPIYSTRERAALAWTEAVTMVAQTHVPDQVYDEARRHFSAKELVDLTLAIAAINAWNRLLISMRTVPGSFEPAQAAGAR
jgi:AhpD family alkylhydroperoxidase